MIEMRNIVKSFNSQTVLRDINLDVSDYEVFGLLGPSGAGKTTIINILTNQLDADSGAHLVSATPAETGLMLDQDGLYTRLSCLENLNVFASIYGLTAADSKAALASVGLADATKKPVSALSHGMRQRLALARAILNTPRLLFLDEPTSGLDPTTARGIHKLILGMRESGTTIFLTTHNMDEAVKLCDRVVLLHKGVIVEQGAPIEICQRYSAMKTVPDLESVFIRLTGTELDGEAV